MGATGRTEKHALIFDVTHSASTAQGAVNAHLHFAAQIRAPSPWFMLVPISVAAPEPSCPLPESKLVP
jgi:hypothetical protein